MAKQRIVRIAFGPGRLVRQLVGQREQRHFLRVQTGREEVGNRVAIRAIAGRNHAVHIGAQIAVGGEFQHLADVGDEGVFARRHIDPTVWPQHLQTAHIVLQQQREQTTILVRAHALVGLALRLTGVVDDLQAMVARRADQLVERIGLLAEGDEKRIEQTLCHRACLVEPVEHGGFEFGQFGGPLVRALQAPPDRMVGIA